MLLLNNQVKIYLKFNFFFPKNSLISIEIEKYLPLKLAHKTLKSN